MDDGELYVWDGFELISKTTLNGDVATRILHGAGIDTPLAEEDASTNNVLWGLANPQGSITDLLDFDAGTSATTVVEHRVFDSFGNIVSDSNTNVAWHHGYTGREWDEDAGLYYYRARWFDPAPGCFLSEDPLGFSAGDVNTTRYVHNDPVNFTDPSGMQEDGPGFWTEYFYYLTHPSAMDTDLEIAFYVSAGIGAGASVGAGAIVAGGVMTGTTITAGGVTLASSAGMTYAGGAIFGAGLNVAIAVPTAMWKGENVASEAVIAAVTGGLGGAAGGVSGTTKLSAFGSGALGGAMEGGVDQALHGGGAGEVAWEAAEGAFWGGVTAGVADGALRHGLRGKGAPAAHFDADPPPLAKAQSIAQNAAREPTRTNATRLATEIGDGDQPMAVVRTIGRGERTADILAELKTLTFTTGNEHAVVKLADGSRALIAGGPGGITFADGEITRIFVHSHPYHLPATGPSAADFAALDALGQRSSYLLEHGQLTRFGR